MSWNQQPSWDQSSAQETSFVSADVRDERVGAFLSKVYGWMFVGLLITAVIASAVASSPALVEAVIVNRLVFWVIVIAQLGLVFYLSARVNRIAPITAAGLFILYSGLVGVTSSVVLLVFTGASIAQTFIVTAGMFGATLAVSLNSPAYLTGAFNPLTLNLAVAVLAATGLLTSGNLPTAKNCHRSPPGTKR